MATLSIPRLNSSSSTFLDDLKQHLHDPLEETTEIKNKVAEIVSDVVQSGDRAIKKYTSLFDYVDVDDFSDLEVSTSELQTYWEGLSQEEQDLLSFTYDRVKTFHETQLQSIAQSSELVTLRIDEYGNELGQLELPLECVGIYVPGGTAAYPSTVLMTATIAKVAGVEKLVATVPTPNNQINPLVFAALHLCGVDRVFRVGGAQAIAGMAYGTETIPRVDKIVGPGNAYVAEAKAQVVRDVGIDEIAGPSEILVIADGTSDARLVALDLLSQAEHDPLSRTFLVTTSADMLDAVEDWLDRLLSNLPRKEIASQALENRSLFLLVSSSDQAASVSNLIAPEHVELMVEKPDSLLQQIQNAGAIFVGKHSAEVMGDYVAGPSHVLPTSGTARFSSPLSVHDFLRRSSVIRLTEQGASVLGQTAAKFADIEGLQAHAQAASARVSET